MKLPEYLLSTPRLIAVLLTLATIYLVVKGGMDVKDFLPMYSFVLGYFFGARGKEEKKEGDVEDMESKVN